MAHSVGGAPDPEQYCPAGHGRLLPVEPAGQKMPGEQGWGETPAGQ